ncbi:pimeloyl-ACP methyl esterase BioG family protein [Paracoccus xiamenensis]|uniref:pimeloyl-ACP methyl esterase BioG family protein n=1 Tax=Paracoccus xiamenensis TaxID=2714901 RepID=UPI001407DCB4|nr:pimeloyl-ACP methyl esterase BioG family protein [Paracoccus xiamenensis]NHF72038.1 DUF452 family protein [Paracoccus xiamenensis]
MILVFGGWALGPAPFLRLSGGQDVLFVDDYRQLDDPLTELRAFDHITLVAFSFGVAAAAHWMSMTGTRPARSVAISGTLFPADPERGIAPDIIRATAEGLSAASFAKFCLRAGLGSPAPDLDIESARTELLSVLDRGPAPETAFDRIWIPQKDRIIPTAAQELAWTRQREAVCHIPGPHVPFRVGQSWAEWIE